MNRAQRRALASGKGPKRTPRGTRRTIDFSPPLRFAFLEIGRAEAEVRVKARAQTTSSLTSSRPRNALVD